jgi:hypothetical protein
MAAEEVHREDSCLEVSRLISKRSNDPYWLRVQRPRSWENTACQTYVRWGFGDFRALDAVHKSGICTQAQELFPRLCMGPTTVIYNTNQRGTYTPP